MKVFVYGTLMEDEPNNYLLGRDARWIGDGETKPIYTLYDMKYFPAMVFGGNTSIKGEVYEVSEKALNNLDHLEGYDSKRPERSLYNRQLIVVKLKKRDVIALAYYIDKEHMRQMREIEYIPTIPGGDWREVGEWKDEPLINKEGRQRL